MRAIVVDSASVGRRRGGLLRQVARQGAVLAAAATLGCADPAADVLVAWVDAIDDGQGTRSLQVYERGERFELAIAPVVPGSGTEQLRIQIDSRGDGIAVSGEVSTRYSSLLSNRQPVLSRDAAGGQTLADAFTITRNGDAVLRGFEADTLGVRAIMPTTSSEAGTVRVLEPPTGLGNMRLLQASDAPVLFWVTQVGAEPLTYVQGPVQAMLYPSDHGGVLPAVDDLTVLAAGQIVGAPEDSGVSEQRAADDWCPGRACVSPDGRSLVTRGVAACTFEWWRWEDADPADPARTLLPRTVTIDDVCPDLSEPWSLFAQVGYDTVVLDDDNRFYVVDLSTGAVESGPRLWSTSGVKLMADRGRAVVLIGQDSRVTRIDADGVRLLSTEAHLCAGEPSQRVSESGYWIVRACNGDGTFLPSEDGTVLRISPLGLETFNGIPMEPLAIDDEGNAVLFSFDKDGDPRGLFVLTSDGQVSRVDALEPQPARIRTPASATRDAVFFESALLRP